jgi:hypothetical protein
MTTGVDNRYQLPLVQQRFSATIVQAVATHDRR